MSRRTLCRWIPSLAGVFLVSLLSAFFLVQTWRLQESDDRELDRVAASVSLLPMGKAYAGTGPWPSQATYAEPLLLAGCVNTCDIQRSGPGGALIRTSGIGTPPPDASTNPSYIFALAFFFFCVHTVCVVGLSILYRLASNPSWMRSKGLAWSVMPRSLILAAAWAFAWPAVTQLIWSLWLRVPTHVMGHTMTTDAVTGQATLSPDHLFGVAVGPAGRTLVLAGMTLGYLLTVAWVIRSEMKRLAIRQGLWSRACAGCGYPYGQFVHCPECGVQPGTQSAACSLVPNHHATSRLHWVWRVALVALPAALLAGPLLLGWLGALLPDELWQRCVPY
ncbi:MAG: hypothetical protein R3B57_03765 [Phycisphaerales bacterium]